MSYGGPMGKNNSGFMQPNNPRFGNVDNRNFMPPQNPFMMQMPNGGYMPPNNFQPQPPWPPTQSQDSWRQLPPFKNLAPPPMQQPPFINQPPSNRMNSSANFAQRLALKGMLKNYSDKIFIKHDANRSGYLDVREIYPAISEVFMMCNIEQPTYEECLTIMKSYDTDGNGLLDVDEFRNLIFTMNGY